MKSKKTPKLLHTLEDVRGSIDRMVVPGGWIYYLDSEPVFVRDNSILVCNTEEDLAHAVSELEVGF